MHCLIFSHISKITLLTLSVSLWAYQSLPRIPKRGSEESVDTENNNRSFIFKGIFKAQHNLSCFANCDTIEGFSRYVYTKFLGVVNHP